ncbi:hypothetical protein QPK87_15480 [Kamptonema cortianum]|nr:hypothetical protein [Oscillatoria laete-virens]MDK3157965.1 hypothetical protein [Kamptonema cortianum]MDL5046090.1 hypothetical protein [Oscillatoria amoena NRMC-F 0135]MDL5052794.1 hypothetical protein [Oscillatoria laete-virens NRMC-F 0139]
MRGSPLIQAAVAAFFILLLAWPVHHLTSPRAMEQIAPPPSAAPEQIAAAGKGYSLEIVFSGSPSSSSFQYLGEPLTAESAPAKPDEPLRIMLPPSVTDSGIDLIAQVQWPRGAGQNAFEVRFISPEGRVIAARTLWSRDGKFEGRIPLP